MKIAQVTPFFHPNKGGVEEYVYQISSFLKKGGNEVEILTSNVLRNSRKKLKKYEKVYGIKIFRFQPILFLGNFGSFWPQFVSKILRENYNIVHVHVYRHPHTFLALLACKIKKIPCIITTHSPFHPSTSIKRRLLTKFFDFFFSWYLLFFDRVIFITPEEKKKIAFNIYNSEIIPHGIPRFFFRKSKTISYDYEKDRSILFVGRIHPSKGLEFLLDILIFLKNKLKKDVELNLVGPNEDEKYYNQLKEKIRKHKLKVKFYGPIKREKLPEIYDKNQIVVLPSIYEAFGIVILEAFSRGKPVVAVDSDGPRYLIKNGENGFLVKYGDVKKMAEAIEKLLNDKKLYKKISKNNRIKAKQFTWDKIVKKLIKVYEDVL